MVLTSVAMVAVARAATADVVALEGAVVPSGQHFQVTARVAVAPGFHVNADQPSAEYLVPTRLTLSADGLSFSEPQYPPPVTRAFAFAPGEKLRVFSGSFSITSRATGEPRGAVRARLRYQACDETRCLPPGVVEAEFSVPASVSASVSASGSEGTASQAGGNKPAANQIVSHRTAARSEVASWLEQASFPVALIAMFLLGLTLNLTPCVYPLVSVTVGYFGSQARHRDRPWSLACAYVLGIALSFAALGVAAAWFGGLFGSALQHPAVLIGLAAVLTTLAASSFGWFTLRVPEALVARAGRAFSGLTGALLMGLTMGVVAAPCIGPVVVGLLIYVGAERNLLLGFSLFLALGLGMGAPYVGLALAAGSINRLPRAGEWLGWVERLFGVLLLGMALYFLTPLLGVTASRVLVPLFVGAAGLYLGFLDPAARALRSFNAFRKVAGALVILAAIWLGLLGSEAGNGIRWQPLSVDSLDRAMADGRPVVLEFGAEWCLPCKELERTTFLDPDVTREASRFSMLQADITESSPESDALLGKFGVLGVPTMIFYDTSGAEVDRVIGFIDAEGMVRLMRKAAPGEPTAPSRDTAQAHS